MSLKDTRGFGIKSNSLSSFITTKKKKSFNGGNPNPDQHQKQINCPSPEGLYVLAKLHRNPFIGFYDVLLTDGENRASVSSCKDGWEVLIVIAQPEVRDKMHFLPQKGWGQGSAGGHVEQNLLRELQDKSIQIQKLPDFLSVLMLVRSESRLCTEVWLYYVSTSQMCSCSPSQE